MRWRNKGKEFEQQANQINNSDVYIFGAGEIGQVVYEQIAGGINIAGFVDNSLKKQGSIYLSKRVFSLGDIDKDRDNIFIISASETYAEEIKSGIEKNFGEKHTHIFEYQDFLSLYFLYVKNEIFIKSLNVSLTQKCSLNCEKCSVLTPYLKQKKDVSLDQLKKDMDLFFDKVDYLGSLSFVGGEPFLYPYLEEYLLYVMQNYRARITFKWNLITNGTIVPSNKVMEIVHKFGGTVSISDYSNELPDLKEKIESVVRVLEKSNVNYYIGKSEEWIDFGYNSHIKDSSEEQMELFFDKCHMPCRLLQDGKLYYCANARFAELADMNKPDSNNIFELGSFKKDNAGELIEFDCGFSEKGYVDMCRRCNGYLSINRNYVPVAKQAER